MQVQDRRGRRIELGKQIGQGGEARILEVKGKPKLVAKVYHANKMSAEQEAKLKAMLAKPPTQPKSHTAIAWPVELLYQQGQLVGFLMPKIKGYDPIVKFYNPARRRTLPIGFSFNRQYLHRTAYNLAVAVEAIHHAGHLIGDVNESNILANNQALVTLVDTDSFQIVGQQGKIYRSPVGKPEYTPRELQGVNFQHKDRKPEHDYFGLAVLIFQLLMEGQHPFNGVLPAHLSVGRVDLYGIKQGLFPYQNRSTMTPPKNAPSFDILHPDIQTAFIHCFVDGHQYPTQRLTAKTWQSLIEKAEKALIACARDSNHLYSNHLKGCPYCAPQPATQKALAPARRTTPQRALPPARRTTPQRALPPARRTAPQASTASSSRSFLPVFLPTSFSVAILLLIILLIGTLAIASLGGFGDTANNAPLDATIAGTEKIAVASEGTKTPTAAGVVSNLTTKVSLTVEVAVNADATKEDQALTNAQATPDAHQAMTNAQATAHAQTTADAQATINAQATFEAQEAANAQATAKAQEVINAQATAEAQEIINAQVTAEAQAATNAQATAQAQAAAEAQAAAANVQKHNVEQIYVPAGEFMMGLADDDPDAYDSQKPRHRVYLDAFSIDKTEVTNAMFATFLNERGNQVEGSVTWLDEKDNNVLIERVNGFFQPKNGSVNHPVVEVSWYGANVYCQWAGHRLPTEAEWEKAAGGTDGRKWPWGNDAPNSTVANFDRNVDGTAPVGSYPAGASPYGALDMAGNVSEWVFDSFDPTYYASSPRENPTGPSSIIYIKIHRGGSWFFTVPSSSVRGRSWGDANVRDVYIGFRCARSP